MNHNWVKMVFTPIEVLPGADRKPVVMVDPDKERVAQEQATYGCIVCDEPLETHFGTDCVGAS
jgi:hypothetical protein